ncbi:DUF1566 domain-containing protein [Leptospira ilyithenensis]|nr:DUF1566 domain-containing protein [Leptospira ilyithenensis]
MIVLPAILFCKPSLDDQCDPFGEKNKSTLLLRTLLGDNSIFCGKSSSTENSKVLVAPTTFQCPSDTVPILNGNTVAMQVTTNGTELTYSINSDLPSGLTLDTKTGNITGSYTSYRGFLKNYTITGSNSLGTASCTFNPKFMGKLPFKTNIVSCWDSSGGSDPTCTGPVGQDGSLQLGTSNNFTGPTLVGADPITTDNVTGLIWTSCSIGQTDINCLTGTAGTFGYTGAQSACSNLDTLNSGAGYANLKGWRIPEREEYSYTINHNTTNPAIFTTYFPQTVSFNYKTNTIPPSSPTIAWYPTFIEGTYGAGALTDAHYLRCVTNATFDTAKRYLDNQNGTVTDLNTSLVWQKCTAGFTNVTDCTGGSAATSDWLSAMNTCNALSLAGRTWRLPNNKELLTLADLYITPSPAAIDSVYFPNTSSSYYWTSSTLPTGTAQAWFVGFGIGENGFIAKSTTTNYTRCVSSF